LLSDPRVPAVGWLDLACGRGQILTGLGEGFSDTAKSKIEYTGYDRSDSYVRETEKLASGCGLHSHRCIIGDLGDVHKLLADEQFEFITLTNTVHEIRPRKLAAVLVDAILRLSPTGILFIYDMESISPHELGAVPWSSGDLKAMLCPVLETFKVGPYDPPVNHWQHRTRNAWSVQIHRNHLATSENLSPLRGPAESATESVIANLLRAKHARCRAALEKLTVYGLETADEQTAKETLLFEFWALSRSLEGE
jgi:hypothetical protein